MVFCGYNNFRPDLLHGLTNITGINEEIDLQGLVETALFIQPKLRTMVFILSTEDISGRANAEKAKDSVIPRYEERYEIVVLEDAPMRQISTRLSDLPDSAAVFILGHTRETVDGRAINPVENSRIISAVSPVPGLCALEFQSRHRYPWRAHSERLRSGAMPPVGWLLRF